MTALLRMSATASSQRCQRSNARWRPERSVSSPSVLAAFVLFGLMACRSGVDTPPTAAAAAPPTAAAAEPTAAAAADAPQVERITYRSGATERRGAAYVPSRAARGEPLPLLLLFDPGGNAEGAVRRWSEAAEARGWLLASTTAIRNGTPDAADEAELLALLEHMRRHHAVDPERVAVSGFSGGGCGAYRIALTQPDVFRGAIVECAHMGSWRELRGPYPTGHPFYLFTRTNDFNRPATQELRDVMTSGGLTVAYAEGSGGHEPMSGGETLTALEWLDARLRDGAPGSGAPPGGR